MLSIKRNAYLFFTLFVGLLLSTLSFGQCTSTNNLTTLYATNNQQDGIMFDVTASATSAVIIKCFDTNLNPGTYNIEIYYKAGTHVGFEGNSAA